MASIFKGKPLINSMLTYAGVWTASDIHQQKVISKKLNYDHLKTIRVALTGTFVMAPLVFGWVRFMDKMLPGKAALTVIKKVITEAAVFSPVAISSFYLTTGLLERKKDMTSELKEKFIPTYKKSILFWPAVQTINQRFLPARHKVLFICGASFVWTNFLCLMKEKDENTSKEPLLCN